MRKRVSAVLSALLLTPSLALALDMPLPPGAVSVFSETRAEDSYALPIAPFADGTLPVEIREGQVTRQAYRVEHAGFTTLQILAPIRAYLEERGYALRLECDARSCGGFDFRFATEVLPPPVVFVDLQDFRFLSAVLDDRALSVLVSGTQDLRFVQVIEVAPEGTPPSAPTARPIPSETNAAVAPAALYAESLAVLLETRGRVVLDDLTFETGRTDLSQGPYGSLEALARYLRARPNARIALVGHTDAVGGLDGNVAISKARADAVRDRLTSRYEVPAGQITSHGIGFLSPRASNLSETGRAQNRRVEAVLIEAP